MPDTMRAVVLDRPGPASSLRIEERPIPAPREGWALLRVHAFGLNRSELHTRLGLAEGVTFPRVLGIEATGVIVAAPGTDLPVGSKAVAMMGGMGRTFDGGYAEYTLVPASSVVPVDTDLDWARLGALPEVLQTAYGSLISVGIRAEPGDTVLVRGGTSSVGLVTAVLAKRRGMRVLSTTRRADRAEALHAAGVDDVVVDTGSIVEAVRALVPEGVDGALELVGAPTLQDTLRCTRPGGTVCFTGMLSNQWIVPEFYPIGFIPSGVRLTAYGGGADDLPSDVLKDVADAMLAGELSLPTVTYALEDIVQAHDDMEHDRVVGKQVVLTS